MERVFAWCIGVSLAIGVLGAGCTVRRSEFDFDTSHLAHYQEFATEIEYPDVEGIDTDAIATTPSPITLRANQPPQFRDITLQQAIEIALTNSEVLRDLQGLVLLSPDNARTVKDPAIQETDPIFGIESALSEFDAMFDAVAFFEKNDRALNNQFFGGGTRLLKQDLHLYRAEISKKTATGTDFAIRHNFEYDCNNSPGNDDPDLGT